MNYLIYCYQMCVVILEANVEFASKVVIPVLTRL
jgi:hypothetical protein